MKVIQNSLLQTAVLDAVMADKLFIVPIIRHKVHQTQAAVQIVNLLAADAVNSASAASHLKK